MTSFKFKKKGDFLEHYFLDNENLKSEIRTISYKYNDTSFLFLSDNGVFSKDKIDYASNLLVTTFLKNNNREYNTILDVGCGYGFIGIVISRVLNKHVDMIDINNRALHLTERNIKDNKVDANAFYSDAYGNVNNKYDLIITNPPIRVGKNILLNILIEAKEHLKTDGELWFVINKNQGAKSIEKELEKYYEITCLEKSKGFYIFRSKVVDK